MAANQSVQKQRRHKGGRGSRRGPFYRLARRLCPRLLRFLTKPSDGQQLMKAVLGFPIGALLGVGLHFAVISRLRIPEYGKYLISGIFLAALAIGFALSIQARCIAILTLPTFCGKAGRSYIGTFALAFLISGPIANLVDNAAEITRSVRCGIELSYNLSASRMKLRFQPIKEIMQDLQKQGTVIHRLTARVKKEFLPIMGEVEDDSEIESLKKDSDYVDSLQQTGVSRTAEIEERYKERANKKKKDAKVSGYERKLDYRCEDVFSIGVKQCRKLFTDAEKKCMSKLKVAGHILCLPLKLSVICELVKLVPGATGMNCDATNAVNDGFGNGYDVAFKAANDMDKNFEVNMQYQVVKSEEDVDRITADEVSKGMAYEFERRQVWFNFIMDLVNTIMTFLFIRVLISSFKYHKKFATDFRYDNIYLSSYFRRIDARRHRQRKRTLFPLKKLERKDVIDPSRSAMTGPEVRKMVSRTVKLLLEVFTFTIIIMVDRIIYESMDIIGRHSQMEFKQTGSHNISLTVHGKGVMGKLMRTLLGGFNRKHAIHDLASNVACLPQPVKMPNEYLFKIGGTFLVLWCFIVIEAYTLRLRRVIAGFFYPKREKKRILFLYNDMLKKRKGFLRHTRHQVRRNAKERQLRIKTSMLTSLQRQWPRLCFALKIFKLGREKCLICEESYNKMFVRCPTPRCRFVYCRECWRDVRRKCYACRRKEDWDSDSSSS